MAGGVTRGEQLAGYVGFRVSQVLPAREMWVASCYRTAIDFYNILMIVKNSIGDRGSLPKPAWKSLLIVFGVFHSPKKILGDHY